MKVFSEKQLTSANSGLPAGQHRIGEGNFNCPFCNTINSGFYGFFLKDIKEKEPVSKKKILLSATCNVCSNESIFAVSYYEEKNDSQDVFFSDLEEILVYPQKHLLDTIDLPNPDMPEDIKKDYTEAASIAELSPRASAALSRLATQKLVNTLVDGKKDLNTKIGELIKQGLPEKFRKAFDVLRVYGNNGVHPGQIDVDNKETAISLLKWLNLLVEYEISNKKEIDSLFDQLPSGVLKGIEQRDTK